MVYLKNWSFSSCSCTLFNSASSSRFFSGCCAAISSRPRPPVLAGSGTNSGVRREFRDIEAVAIFSSRCCAVVCAEKYSARRDGEQLKGGVGRGAVEACACPVIGAKGTFGAGGSLTAVPTTSREQKRE